MPCKNPFCKSTSGRKIFSGFCSKCRAKIRRDFKRHGWKLQ